MPYLDDLSYKGRRMVGEQVAFTMTEIGQPTPPSLVPPVEIQHRPE